MEEYINILEELRKELGLSADGNKIKQGQALENLMEKYNQQNKIINDTYREANNTLYFDDSSDYYCALWNILKIINPDLEEYPNLKNILEEV